MVLLRFSRNPPEELEGSAGRNIELQLCIVIADAMAIGRHKLLLHFLVARSCSLSFLRSSPWISQSYFHESLSTLAEAPETHAIHSSNAYSQYPNPFAEFAATKFDLPSQEIACILKNNPSLERLKTLDRVERFVDMLKRYGCTQQQISSTMKRLPKLLNVNPDKVIEPKIQVLRDLGIEGEDLAKIMTRCPRILSSSLQHSLIPALTFLKNIYKTPDLLIKAISKSPSILTYDLDKYLKPSVAFWEGCGFTGEQLAKSLSTRPGLLLCTSLTSAKADLLRKIGNDNGSRTYKHVLIMVVCSRTETLEAKVNNFQRLGLTTEETMELFRAFPYVFCLSQETIRQKFEFIVSKMGLPAHSVVKVPQLLPSSLEKVVKPRLLVLQKMKSLNGDEDVLRGISSILRMSAAMFENKVIKEHDESTLLNQIYQEALTNASTKSKMKPSIQISKKCWYF